MHEMDKGREMIPRNDMFLIWHRSYNRGRDGDGIAGDEARSRSANEILFSCNNIRYYTSYQDSWDDVLAW